MDNDFCRYSIRRFISLITYIESVLLSLESHCLLISDRINNLNSRLFLSEKLVLDLDCRKEFLNFANYSIRDFMILDDKSILKNSYHVLLKECKQGLVLINENFPKFFNSAATLLNKLETFSERAVDVNMDDTQSKSFEPIFRCQRKEDIKVKAKKATSGKSKRISNFKSSLEKLFRIKSKSEKSLKHDDLLLGMIPSTIYLTPQQTVSLSRDTWYIAQKNQPNISESKQSIRHSCSDFVCRRSSTFCTIDNVSTIQRRSIIRAVSPPGNVFYPVSEEVYLNEKLTTPSYNKVTHSTSMPAHLSKSHQNITTKCNKDDLDNCRPAKRTARKKGFFNCSLFRKRWSSHSKSVEKIVDIKGHNSRCRDKSKSLNRSENKISSTLSDRCLTLPNLKSSEVDLTQNVQQHQLLSMDLIKDYLNRSDHSLQSSIHQNSNDCTVTSLSQPFPASVHSSPHSLSKCYCDLKKFKTSKIGLCDSMILENSRLSESFYSQPSASSDLNNPRCSRATSPLTINNSAFDNSTYKYSIVTPTTTNEHPKPPCLRQISAPICYQPCQPSHQYLSSTPTNSAYDFWTRPYHEKMKASRRRLLDDKVGSKEALLRSLSPHNIKPGDGNAIYDNPYHLHIIPEPSLPNKTDCVSSEPCSQSPKISHSKSFYNAVQYRLTNHDNIFPDYRPHSSASPVIENRLRESPISISNRQDGVRELCGNDYLIYHSDNKSEITKLALTVDGKVQFQKEPVFSNSNKISQLQLKDFVGSCSEIKDTKSINSSTELVLTRTPTPPHSFAESSVSSIYPAPNEFTCDLTNTQTNNGRLCGTVNLLYSSDNSDDDDDYDDATFDKIEIEPMPPVPPPRTDSVLRSLQVQQNIDADKSELEYDISDEFPPIFTGANIDRCDIEEYHKWLAKLPYKITEFPNLIQCRKSTVIACKMSPLIENHNCVTTNIEPIALKQTRKSIKSWNTSESSKRSDNASIGSHASSSLDSCSMKKSFSYDQCLNSSEMQSIVEISPTADTGSQFPVIDSTLLKQYSHLYSLKASPSQTNATVSVLDCSGLKFQRSKSIDLRNFVNNVSGQDDLSQHRKSVPNSKMTALTTTTNEISGKTALDTAAGDGSAYKLYPML